MTLNYTKQTVFLYELTYRASTSFSVIFGDPQADGYVCHADDLLHLFPIMFHRDPTAKDLEISNLIITMWTNFAISGYVHFYLITFHCYETTKQPIINDIIQ